MSKGVVGVEREIVLNTLMHDQSPLMVSPVVKKGVAVDSMTLQSDEYKIYPEGILFFKRFLSQWQVILDVLASNRRANVRMSVVFYHRGRGLFFISSLKKVRNGYALMIPERVQKLQEEDNECVGEINAKIFLENSSGIHAKCQEVGHFTLFNNNVWQNFSRSDFENSQKFLKEYALLEESSLGDKCKGIITNSKKILYAPEKKIPKRNFFPFSATITERFLSYNSDTELEKELEQCQYSTYIPLCARPSEPVHTILGAKAKMVLLSPSDLLETIVLLPLCRYLGIEHKSKLTSSSLPHLDIICITDSAIVLGMNMEKSKAFSFRKTTEHDFPLMKYQEYVLQLRVPVENMVRTISVRINVSNIYKNDSKAACALCRFINLQEEDRRFLYEKYYKTKMR